MVETRSRGSVRLTGHPPAGTLPGIGEAGAPWLEPLPLSPGRVVVYAFRLDVTEGAVAACRSVLTPVELRQAARFAREELGRRWIVARGTLRRILGAYLAVHPGSLVFACGPFGKPALAGDCSHPGLEFNLSHSENLGLVAVAYGLPVGVDVEIVRPLEEFDDLVERFFSAREAAGFARLPASAKAAAFYNLWTRKEAWLKATGDGIGNFLNRVEVTFLPGEPARLLQWPRLPGLGSAWRLVELHPAAGYAAALAAGASEFQVQFQNI